MMDYEIYYYKYGNVKCLQIHTKTYSHNRQEIDLHREEDGTERKAMETRHTSHNATFLA